MGGGGGARAAIIEGEGSLTPKAVSYTHLVVINSGSGNQGMTASIPVVVYAKELNSGADKMYRALALSNPVSYTHLAPAPTGASTTCGWRLRF